LLLSQVPLHTLEQHSIGGNGDRTCARHERSHCWTEQNTQRIERTAEQEALRRATLEPMWKRELKRLREQGQQLELPLLAEEMVLPTE
jgi:hypothetical protein